MRDPAGELADRLHFLALLQAGFEVALLGHVVGDDHQARRVADLALHRTDGRAADELAAVAAAAGAFAIGVAEPLRFGDQRVELRRRHIEERRRGLVGHLVARVAENVLRAGLPRRDAPAVIEHEQRVVLDAVEHQAHPRLDFAQPAFRGAALPLSGVGDELRVVEGRGA